MLIEKYKSKMWYLYLLVTMLWC